tara:strand:- start:178 stop:378 length:201 start_codon:yes stop_codon:yes gene_type:complete
MGGHEVMKAGSVVKILKPHGFTIDEPVAILISKLEYTEEGDKKVAWHCLCDDRMILLYEEEFEVVG